MLDALARHPDASQVTCGPAVGALLEGLAVSVVVAPNFPLRSASIGRGIGKTKNGVQYPFRVLERLEDLT